MDLGLAIAGLVTAVIGVGFGVDQWRQGRQLKRQLDGLDSYLRTRNPQEAVASATRVTEEALAQAQHSEQELVEDVQISPHLREGMARAIAELPERERLVLTLSFWEHLSTPEIAKVL